MKKTINWTEYEIEVVLNWFSFDFKISEKKEVQKWNVKSLEELIANQDIFKEDDLKQIIILPF